MVIVRRAKGGIEEGRYELFTTEPSEHTEKRIKLIFLIIPNSAISVISVVKNNAFVRLLAVDALPGTGRFLERIHFYIHVIKYSGIFFPGGRA